MTKEQKDKQSEIGANEDEVLRRMLSTPPKPEKKPAKKKSRK